ncbi:unnamed protein product, partial [marine sediment metagenome]
DQYSGQAGKAGVFAKWKGRQYRRAYVIPANPDTLMQKWIRDAFKECIRVWHTYHSIQRLAFSYLATGQVMSGMNLLVRRWQNATAKVETLPLAPKEGVKQICSASVDNEGEVVTSTANPCTLDVGPVSIGSLKSGSTWASNPIDAFVDIEMGDVRLPVQVENVEGQTGGTTPCAVGDQIVISYKSGGRTITHEVLLTFVTTDEEFAARALIGEALRTAFYPIDFKSAHVYVYDLSETTYVEIEAEEIDNINHQAYLDKTELYDATDQHNYTSFTAIKD